ncbi:MAG: geranylgeranylglycerol-phosphate geranylgeranyltransferase [Methanoregulaceae archaeon]|nr:geranylgeranylglycerol-phosphate geranylgeranyltransferase [Methanoregulaceae archaeon]
MRLSGFPGLMRPVNALVAGLSGALGYLVATGTIIPGVAWIILTVILVTGAGNALNDYCDAGIDRINRPDRPIPSGRVQKHQALVFAALLFIAGICTSLLTNLFCVLIAVFNSILLIAYAVRLKSTPGIGNVAVAYLSGSIFLFGGALAGLPGLEMNLPLFLITFLATLARELLKDAEDVEGDSASGARTLPILAGVKPVSYLASVCGCVAVLASIIPFGRFGLWYLLAIAPVDALIMYACMRSVSCRDPECVRKSGSTSLLKTGMFAALAVFCGAAVLLQ